MRRRASEGGYTLLEMLIVMAIFSLVIGLAVPSLRGSSSVMSVKQAEATLVSAFREARAQAVAGNRQARVTLDLDTNSLMLGASASELLGGEDMKIEMTTARALVAGPFQSTVQGATRGAIVFFPDGSSSGGRVTMRSGGAVSVVEVDWMTGMARVVKDGDGERDG